MNGTVKSYIKLLLAFIERKRLIFFLSIIQILVLFSSILTIYLNKIFIDNVLIDKNIKLLNIICLLYILAFLVQIISENFNYKLSNRITFYFNSNIRNRLFNKLLYSNEEVVKNYSIGEIILLLDQDVDRCESFIINTSKFIYSVSYVFIVSIILFYTNFTLAIVCFISLPLTIWMTKIFTKKLKNQSYKYREEFSNHKTNLLNIIRNIKDIKTNNSYNFVEKLIFSNWEKINFLFKKQQSYWNINKMLFAFKEQFFVKTLLYSIGGYMIFKDNITVGTLIIVVTYQDQIFVHLDLINEYILEFSTMEPIFRKLYEVIDIHEEPANFEKDFNEINSIEIKKVSFGYEKNINILKNINIDINSNGIWGIVGKSGSGKTTLVKLISRLLKASDGEINFNTKNINDFSIEQLYSKIAIVMQEPFFFNLSIRENLQVVNKSISEQFILNCCEKVGILDDINNMELGLDTIIGERGAKLSGGQKQKLAIVRAIIQDTPIIILDEATSSMDKGSEDKVIKLMNELKISKKIIVISHKFEVVNSADQIMVMNEGEIVDIGKVEYLTSYSNLFKNIFNINSDYEIGEAK